MTARGSTHRRTGESRIWMFALCIVMNACELLDASSAWESSARAHQRTQWSNTANRRQSDTLRNIGLRCSSRFDYQYTPCSLCTPPSLLSTSHQPSVATTLLSCCMNYSLPLAANARESDVISTLHRNACQETASMGGRLPRLNALPF